MQIPSSNAPRQVPKFSSNDAVGKKKQQFWHSTCKMRELIIASMDDEITPAEGTVSRPPWPPPARR